MRSNEATNGLASEIVSRRLSGQAPPAIFLGAGVARTVGAPSAADVGGELFEQLRKDPSADQSRIPLPDADEAEVARRFSEALLRLDPFERASVTLRLSAAIPVRQCLQDLATLIRDGTFATVITTSFDALLERALVGAGLRIDRDFRVVDVSEHVEPPEFDSERRVTLVKLHGEAILEGGPLVEEALASTIVVVGHEETDPPLVDAFAVPGGPVWWVAPPGPPTSDLRAYRRAREVTLIDGEAGDPDRFLGELSLLLVQMPAVNILSRPAESLSDVASVAREASAASARQDAGQGLGTVSSAVLAHLGGTTPPEDEDEFERQFLRSRLQRAREALRKLEEEVAGGAIDVGVRRQLDYQRRVVLGLEARLRELDSERERVIELLHDVQAAAVATREPGIATYVTSLVELVEGEFDSPQPNEDIVSASLGAMTILADRVGVDSGLVRQLAAYAPTTHGTAL